MSGRLFLAGERLRAAKLNRLASAVAGGVVPEAPVDGSTYGRQDSQWVSLATDGVPEAPVDGATYGRKDAQWVDLALPTPDESRIYNVGQADNMFASVQEAITAINAADTPPSANNRIVVQVWPGKYVTTAPIVVPSYVGIVGVSKGLVQFQNDVTNIFTCSNNVWFERFLIEGGTDGSIYAIEGNNANSIHILDVDMLKNTGDIARQKFFRNTGATWEILFMEHCVVDYRGLSSYCVLLENTAAAARFVDANINDCFFDAYNLTNFGGSLRFAGCQDIRVKRTTIRGQATYNTGIRLDLGGVSGTPHCEVRGCDFAGPANASAGVATFNEAGTAIYISNSDAQGSTTAGTRILRNTNV